MEINVTAKANKVFKSAHESKKRYIVMKGGAGSGKSFDTAQMYVIRLMSEKGRNLLAMRKSESTCRNSVFAELWAAIIRLGVSDWWKISPSVPEMRFVNGNTVVFRGMNDIKQREKIKSVTFERGSLTDIWLEEATEFSQGDLEILDDRLRGELPEELFYQIKLTFNPVSAGHWIKKMFYDREDGDVLAVNSTYRDNRFADAEYARRMERRRETDPDGYRIYALGEWGETGGLVLKNWQARTVPKKAEYYDRLYIGQDFGYNDANAILLIGAKDGDIFVISEIYEREKDTGELIEEAERAKLPKKVEMYCDSAEPDRIKTWKKAGFAARPVEKESGCIAAGIDFLKRRMIYVDPSCKNTIWELSQWKWKADLSTGEYEDIPVDADDHAMSALRYAVEGMRKKRAVFALDI